MSDILLGNYGEPSGAGSSRVAIANPLRNPIAWSTFLVGDAISPGVIPPGGINGFELKYEWDVKKGKGAAGATTTFTQVPPIEGTITCHLWRSIDFEYLQLFLPLLMYNVPKEEVEAFQLSHPALGGVRALGFVTRSISPLRHEGQGLYSIEFSFLEFRPAPKKSATATVTAAATGKGNGFGTYDPVEQRFNDQIDDLLKKAKLT